MSTTKQSSVVTESAHSRLPFPTDHDGLDAELMRRQLASRMFDRERVKVGRFVLEEFLGAGGMGLVYRAYDEQLDRSVALKLLRRDLYEASPEAHDDVYREARALARLSHPNVVQVYEVGVYSGSVFISMEFVAGLTLDAWRRARPRMHWREIYATYLAAGRGLVAAHEAGIVHRDFKPHNVLLGEDGRVRVADFGLAQDVAARELGESASTSSSPEGSPPESITGARLVGTPAYMAPEQLHQQPATELSDQFSYCVAFWEALYGRRPYSREQLIRPRAGELGEPGRSPAPRRVPTWLSNLLSRGLALAPEARHPSLASLLTALERQPRTLARRRGATAVVALGALATVAAVRAGSALEPCSQDRAALDPVWGSEVAARVRAAITAVPHPWSADVAGIVQTRLDDYKRDWLEARRETCLDARVRGVRSEAQFDRSVACLERRKAELRLLVHEFERPMLATVVTHDALLLGLRSVGSCRDLNFLNALPHEPSDASARQTFEDVRERLERARNAHLMNLLGDGLALAAEVSAGAEIATSDPLRAEASLLHGKLLLADGQHARGERTLRDAILFAERSAYDEIRWQAHVALARRALNDLEEPALARRHVAEAQAIVFRTGTTRERLAELQVIEGQVLRFEGKLEQSAQLLSDAVAALEPVRDELPRVYKSALATLADVTAEQGDTERAQALYTVVWESGGVRDKASIDFNLATLALERGELDDARVKAERALALDQEQFGADNPRLASDYLLLATIEFNQEAQARGEAAGAPEGGERPPFQRAAENAERALALYDQHYPAEYSERLSTLSLLSGIYDTQRSDEAALRINQALVTTLAATRDAGYIWRESNNVGYFLNALGRAEQAERWYREMSEALATHDAAVSGQLRSVRAFTSSGIAAALLAQKKYAEAAESYERALAEATKTPQAASASRKEFALPSDVELQQVAAEASWGLARALFMEGGDRARVRELAAAARRWHERDGSDPESVVAIERFLKQLDAPTRK